MVKKIFLIFITAFMLNGIVCYAEDLTQYLGDRAVNVVENENEINICMRISITENAEDYMLPNTAVTYADAFFRGIKYMWEGEYNGKPVIVRLERVSSDDERIHVSAIFNLVKDTKSYSCADKHSNTIWIYSGDGREFSSLFYSYKWFTYAAGHEVGHILGLADVYSDENESVRLLLRSPLNYISTPQAQPVDYYMMLKYRTWELTDTLFVYSSDMEGIELFIE